MLIAQLTVTAVGVLAPRPGRVKLDPYDPELI